MIAARPRCGAAASIELETLRRNLLTEPAIRAQAIAARSGDVRHSGRALVSAQRWTKRAQPIEMYTARQLRQLARGPRGKASAPTSAFLPVLPPVATLALALARITLAQGLRHL